MSALSAENRSLLDAFDRLADEIALWETTTMGEKFSLIAAFSRQMVVLAAQVRSVGNPRGAEEIHFRAGMMERRTTVAIAGNALVETERLCTRTLWEDIGGGVARMRAGIRAWVVGRSGPRETQ